MEKFALHYTDEVTYEIEAENKDAAIAMADQYWAERIPTVDDVSEKDWGEQKRTISLTNSQWNRLTTFLLMSTTYREGELQAWEELAKEMNEDGTPKFKNAENNAEFWRGMIKDIAYMRETIDGISLDSTLSRATVKSQETIGDGSKEIFEMGKE